MRQAEDIAEQFRGSSNPRVGGGATARLFVHLELVHAGIDVMPQELRWDLEAARLARAHVFWLSKVWAGLSDWDLEYGPRMPGHWMWERKAVVAWRNEHSGLRAALAAQVKEARLILERAA